MNGNTGRKIFFQGDHPWDFRSLIPYPHLSTIDETQQRPFYNPETVKDLGFKRHSIPIIDFTAPTQEQFKESLEIMNKVVGKVIIHCQGGYGRTGTMGAAYWIAKGLPAHRAINKIRQANPGAVELPEQEESLYELAATI